jgi:AraC family transcriptional regulator of adaptative response / DNA-3-methyladenine glycosylase II
MVTAMTACEADAAADADSLLRDTDACHRVLLARDARFDGRLFVGVRTTGVYCRPICPARTPRPSSCRFFATAAAAQEAGFRPCLRCRPEVSPQLATWRGTSSTVTRALALIREGALDGDGASVESLAERLGIGERQLRRLFREHLGASPVSVAQTRRVLFAKHLLHETRLPMVQVALAAGFGSVRRFNETFRALYGRPPRALRRAATDDGAEARSGAADVVLRLPYAPPYDWQAMCAFLAARAIPGIEDVHGETYRRTLAIGAVQGTIAVMPCAGANTLRVAIRVADVATLSDVVARERRGFDLEAEPRAIAAHLAQDPLLAPLVAARPGLRVPGGWDGFELAVRAILGQQVSVAGARTLAARLVERYGEPLRGPHHDHDGPSRVFPAPARLADADPAALGVPRARGEALRALARAARDDARLFGTAQSLDDAVARLRALPGIGEWTAQYVALRALREPDAFPADDLGLQRALTGEDGRPSAVQLLRRAEAWRPWRAYAAQHLWTRDAAAMRCDAEGSEENHVVKQSAAAGAAALPARDADRRPRAAAGR